MQNRYCHTHVDMNSFQSERVGETRIKCVMKKGYCEAVSKKSLPDLSPQDLNENPNLVIEIDTRICLTCPYFAGHKDPRYPRPITPGEEIKPPIPSHPDIYVPRRDEKKPFRF